MRYLAILDRANLSNSLFVTTFAQSLKNHQGNYSVVLHGDSYYTEELIQTGMMRQDAAIRSTRELNRRLMALFADEGVATIGLHGYQRNTILYDEHTITINSNYLTSLSEQPVLLISNVAKKIETGELVRVPIPLLAEQLATQLNLAEIVSFKINDSRSSNTDTDIPEELKEAPFAYRNITLQHFNNLSKIGKTGLIKP